MRAVLSLSGGMDSTTLALHLLVRGCEITAIGIDYGQKHKIELQRAKALVDYLQTLGFKITYDVIELKGLSSLLVSGLVNNNSMELKKGHYAHENALTSVVPNRNAILSAISYAVALSVVKRTGEECIIALATHMGDFNNNKKQGIYPDCSEEFRNAIEHAFKIGNWDSDKVNYYAPYNDRDKTEVLKDGLACCQKLHLDYKEIYSRTNTSYDPIEIDNNWYSDYESGSSIERVEAFLNLGVDDPLIYASKNGEIVSWELVKEHVKNVCDEWKLQQP
ncbi:MAG: 7-cyano-7-deazaguanine synthase [Novosphingobium sp.]|nr:7-cyano-7-deazaguanine synthase [Novosphingobium sp.]